MSPSPDPRGVVQAILAEVDRGRRLDLAFEGQVAALPSADRRWVQELAWGVVRFRGRIDHLLGLHLRKGTGSLHPSTLQLLRMGAWQILSMGSVPAYAAVSDTVERVRRLPPRAGGGKGMAGVANAVLRRLAEAGGGVERFPALATDPAAHLSTWGSHPRWIVERWIRRYGVEETAALVEANNRIPRTVLRHLPTGEAIPLAPGADVAAALAAHAPALVQDPAAQAVVALAAAGVGPEGGRVADLCAAPGGKGWALAGLAPSPERGPLPVLALDPSLPRLRRMRETEARLGRAIRSLGCGVARGEHPPLSPDTMDVVLVDAPCTGTGTLARHPDARWRLDPGAPAALARVQAAILDGAAGVVRPGGLLVYSTCTLEPEENDDQVRAFLARHPAYHEEARVEILPQASGTDGAFAVRLRKGPAARRTREPERP